MSRFATSAFVALVLATVAAFFITQHLKVSTPLIAGDPMPVPSLLDPVGPASCPVTLASGRTLPNHRRMYISFYLLYRSDDVSVYVVDASGSIVATLASGRHMRKGVRNPDGDFSWDGRTDSGAIAPDGTYTIRVALLHQGRTVTLTTFAGKQVTVTVQTHPPTPRITSVTAAGQEPAIIPRPGTSSVSIHYTGTQKRSALVKIYRTDLPGAPRLVKTFKAGRQEAIWDGLINRRPAPQGTYLVGLKVANAACATGVFPRTLPPVAGSTPHAGVTVHYLVAQPPLTPVAAGSNATVYVDALGRPYRWTLWRVGARRPAATGGPQRGYALSVRLPSAGPGLYHVTIRSAGRVTDVPLLASVRAPAGAASSPGPPHVLVVLPALSWQGVNPVDDDGDGIPNTLISGEPVPLSRPLVDGLPPGFGNEAALLAYLDRAGLPYDLTTDLGLIDGVGPQLTGHTGVVLAGAETWIPPALGQALRTYVTGGGHLLSLGIGSLLRGVTIRGGVASEPTAPAAVDVLGARPGALSTTRELITVNPPDRLGIFSTTGGAFPGYRAFVPITVSAPARLLASAGTTTTTSAIAAYALGQGDVIDVGLPAFASTLATNVNAREFLARTWSVLRR